MAKKKKNTNSTISEEQQLEALQAIAQMSPEQQNDLLAIAEELANMPEELQDQMLDFLRKLGEMPQEEQEQFFEEMDATIDGEEDVHDEMPFDHSEEDDNYPHFLPRANVQKFTLRVTLQGSNPKIYRKFCVPSNITLRHLSELLLQLMGWEGYHMNQFRKGNDLYAPAYQREGEDDMFFDWMIARNHNQEEFVLSDILDTKGKTMEWEYDFGDSWYHDVRLSSIGEYAEGEPHVSFIKGERACPPEDCGGIWGYEELLSIRDRFARYTMSMGKKPSSDDLDRLYWFEMHGDFDPNFYDTELAQEICKAFCG